MNDSGIPGFEVLNPILIDGENYLLNRGWIPFEKKDTSEINILDQNNIEGTLKIQGKKIFSSQITISKKITGLA